MHARRYGKARADAWRRDPTLRTLGYCTQNGAYYYYNPPAGTSYEALLMRLADEAKRTHTPYRYWLADSWWYHKAKPPPGVPRGGVVEWEALTDTANFPSGSLKEVHRRTGWHVQAHARYWSAQTRYAKSNGGRFAFLVDGRTGFALPTERGFWDHLFQRGKAWGLAVFEQVRRMQLAISRMQLALPRTHAHASPMTRHL